MRLFYLLSVLCATGFGLKILVVNPTLGSSHVQFVSSIADTLAEAGHEVHMIVNTIDSRITKYGAKKIAKLVVIPALEENVNNNNQFVKNPFKPSNMLSFAHMNNMTKSIVQACNDIVHYYDELLKPLENEHYDIGITQLLAVYPVMILHMLKVKTTVLASANPLAPYISQTFGIPAPPSYTANPFGDVAQLNAADFSYMDRVGNFFRDIIYYTLIPMLMGRQREILATIDPTIPVTYHDLMKDVSLILVNTPPMLEFATPISHRVINIGGIAMKRDNKINPDVLEIIDKAKKGVIVVSFGTLASTQNLDEKLITSFLSAFAQFPDYEFLFKFDASDEAKQYEKLYPNVHLLKWLQQSAILGHKKTKVFVSHMGLNSFMEASTHGVPFVSIPLFSDQFYNTALAKSRGTAVYIDKMNITKSALVEALQEVLTNTSYTANARILSRQLEKFPENGTAKMIRMIEYVGEFGRLPNWDLKGIELNWFVHASYDVIVPLILVTILVFWIIYRLLKYIICYCCRKRSVKTKKE
ncbi:unnamed protein product, partial [Mesorhabditis belari]|uniref:glucuronosyltransferase n=1 Tax=Mesorhabditis belari TaxID=2138241 RepID=A0AAF3FG32_9BILA